MAMNNDVWQQVRQWYVRTFEWLKPILAKNTPLGRIPGINTLYHHLVRFSLPGNPTWITYRGKQLYIDPNEPAAALRLYHGDDFEPSVEAVLRQYAPPGGIVLDIGGHWGVYTLLLRDLVGDDGRVVVFEPHPKNADMIRRTLTKNGFDDVEVVEAAVSHETNPLILRSVSGNEAASTLLESPDISHDFDTHYEVDVVSLDSYLADQGITNIDLVKLDIQGGEVAAIRTLENHLDSVRTMIIEVHGQYLSDDEVIELYSMLNEHGNLQYLDDDSDRIRSASELFGAQHHILFTQE